MCNLKFEFASDENGQWQDILAKEQSEKLGFYFRLRTDSEIDWTKYRNLKYLGKYLDVSSQKRFRGIWRCACVSP